MFVVPFVPVVTEAVSPFISRRKLFRASWILPIVGPPISDGWVAVDAGRIIAIGGPGDQPPAADEAQVLESAVILPGLVNAHTHLELSWMRNQIAPERSMPRWVGRLMALRGMVSRDPRAAIEAAVREVRAAGTALVGDITNTFASYEPLADSELPAVLFRELLGFNHPDPSALVAATRAQVEALRPKEWLRPVIVPHAPYSVSPALLREIAAASERGPVSIHLGESAEEVEFLRTGGSAWRTLLEGLGAWDPDWVPPGTGSVEYLAAHGLVNERLVAVHCVQLTDDELRTLASAGATVVTCPRSNRWTGAGVAPVERFYTSGVRVAVGTDSLASVEDLNLFAELKVMHDLAPGVTAARLLESATRHGADALGFGDQLGTIEPGRRADLIAVSIPAGITDVEQYLVSGVTPDAIRWLRA